MIVVAYGRLIERPLQATRRPTKRQYRARRRPRDAQIGSCLAPETGATKGVPGLSRGPRRAPHSNHSGPFARVKPINACLRVPLCTA